MSYRRDRSGSRSATLRRNLLSLALAAGAAGCSVEAPEAPVFETDLYVPLGSQRTSGTDLIDDSDYLEGDPAGGSPLSFVLGGEVDTFQVGDLLDLDVPESAFKLFLGSVDLQPPDAIDFDLYLSDLIGPLPPGPRSVPVSPFRFDGLVVEPPDQEGYEWMRIQTGALSLHLENGLAVPIGPHEGDAAIGIRIWDRTDGSLVREVILSDEVEAGGAADLLVDLSGHEMHNQLEVEVWGESPGSGGEAVPLEETDRISVQLAFQDVAGDSAVAAVPAQRTSYQKNVPLAEGIGLLEGTIEDGIIPVTVRNGLPIAGSATIRFPELLKAGAPVEVRVDLPAAGNGGPGVAIAELRLDGTEVETGGSPIGAFSYEIEVTSPGSGEEPVELSTRQEVSGDFSTGSLRFERLVGQLDRREFRVDPSEATFDPPEGIDELDFQAAELALDLKSTLGLVADAEVFVRGYPEGGGDPVVVPVRFSVPAGSQEFPTHVVARIDETNSNILDLIRSRPRRLVLDGLFAVGGDGTIGSAQRSDFVFGTYSLTAPLRMRIGEIVHRVDPFRFTLSADDQDRIRKNVVSGSVHGTIENHFPANLEARLVFAASEAGLETAPAVTLDPVSAAAARLDATGRVVEERRTDFDIPVRADQVDFFARSEVFGQVVLTVAGSDPQQVVEVTALDYIDLKGMLQFRMKVEP